MHTDELTGWMRSVERRLERLSVRAGRPGVLTGRMPALRPQNSANWTVIEQNSWRIAQIVGFTISVRYNGSGITANATGNITDNIILIMDDAAWRPLYDVHSIFQTGYTAGGCTFYKDGNLKIRDMHSGSKISANHTLNMTFGGYEVRG